MRNAGRIRDFEQGARITAGSEGTIKAMNYTSGDLALTKKDNALYGASYELTLSSGVLVHPIAVSKTQFDKWKDVYPLYREVQKDGVVLYDADNGKGCLK